MPFALPRHSPLLPALRNPEAVLAQLDGRRRQLADSGDLTQAARMARRAGRVARWRARAEASVMQKPAAPARVQWFEPVKAPSQTALPEDPVEALIAGLNLARAVTLRA